LTLLGWAGRLAWKHREPGHGSRRSMDHGFRLPCVSVLVFSFGVFPLPAGDLRAPRRAGVGCGYYYSLIREARSTRGFGTLRSAVLVRAALSVQTALLLVLEHVGIDEPPEVSQ